MLFYDDLAISDVFGVFRNACDCAVAYIRENRVRGAESGNELNSHRAAARECVPDRAKMSGADDLGQHVEYRAPRALLGGARIFGNLKLPTSVFSGNDLQFRIHL